MSALPGQWAQWAAKYAALAGRERIVIAAALVFGGGMLIFNFGIEPLLLKERNASRAIVAARTELAQQQAQAAVLKAQNADPDAANRRRLAQIKQELGAVGERLTAFEAGMVPPAKMQAFLERLLARNHAIELMGLKTLPVTLVGAPLPTQRAEPAAPTVAQMTAQMTAVPAQEKPAQEAGGTAQAEGIYQHGIEIRLAGNYSDLLKYLEDIERMPQRLMWNSLGFTVDKYPRNILVLRVYTLSLDRNWLIV
ncbi:MAG: hypothetical protein Q8O52_03560 [Sulfuritalea sp.]|nr:hypothetical protein [Sulfuritalea sp.]